MSAEAPKAASTTTPPAAGTAQQPQKQQQPAHSADLLRVLGFFSGAAVMIIEFSGNRLLAPAFGNSLYTWTGLIGVILVALSCGDYLGGWLVDRRPKTGLLPTLFILGGVFTAAIPSVMRMLPDLSQQDLVWGPVWSSIALFFLPGLVLASVTPVSIRLLSQASADTHIGRSAGTVGMAAALGSFAGTLGTSYFLIPNFGVRAILSLLGGLLIVIGLGLGVLWWRPKRIDVPQVALAIAGFGLMAWSMRAPASEPDVIFLRDTFYHRITVSEQPGFGGKARLLKLDTTAEGAQMVESGEVLFSYQQFWRLAEVYCPKLQHAAFLGAGAFGMPERLSARFPSARVDVVEIDPAVIEVGHKFFHLDKYPKVQAHAADARRYLKSSPEKLDFIFGDAYHGQQYVPAHLVTQEFFAEARARLNEDGVFVMNLIGALKGDGSTLFWRVLNSFRPSFPYVTVYGTVPQNPFEQQNMIIVGSSANLADREKLWQQRVGRGRDMQLVGLLNSRHEIPAIPEDTAVFTDDYNPVEYVVAMQLRAQRKIR
jgi:spermidine synthase